MRTNTLQRTLLVGLGEGGLRAANALLARLNGALGAVGVVASVTVTSAEIEPSIVPEGPDSLTWSPVMASTDWLSGLRSRASTALFRISDLSNLDLLAANGLSLFRQDEVHIVLLADLDEAWVWTVLKDVADMLRGTVYQVLSCHTGMTGILLRSLVDGDEPLGAENITDGDECLAGLEDSFDRGYYLVSLTNETGMVIGSTETLVDRVARFLELLVTSSLETTLDMPAWGESSVAGWEPACLASFGLAEVRWPAEELVDVLSKRWTAQVLTQIVPAETDDDETDEVYGKVASAAKTRLHTERLFPPLILENLSAHGPILPDHLAGLVPDPPWPWQLKNVKRDLELHVQQWEEDAADSHRGSSSSILKELETRWFSGSSDLKAPPNTDNAAHRLASIVAYQTVLARLIQEISEGVEAQLEEAELDLAAIDRRLEAAARALSEALEELPGSWLEALLKWAVWPLGWPARWEQCQRVRSALVEYAGLLRTRLRVLYSLWLYQEMLPFYQTLASRHGTIARDWTFCQQQAIAARESIPQEGWRERLEDVVQASGGPWSLPIIEEVYQAMSGGGGQNVLPMPPGDDMFEAWIQNKATAEEIVASLCAHATEFLSPLLDVPVDKALMRQFADEDHLDEWLQLFLVRATPFLRYDEAVLAEDVRANTALFHCLFLPGAGDSPLAHRSQAWPHAAIFLESNSPQDLVAVSVRKGLPSQALLPICTSGRPCEPLVRE